MNLPHGVSLEANDRRPTVLLVDDDEVNLLLTAAALGDRGFDITTSNLAKSKEFYGKLFGWTFNSVQGSDQAAEIVAGGTGIGTLRGAEGKITPFNGVVYVQVSDLPASCKKAQELGGTIPAGFPFNLPDGIGAIAVLVDPAATRLACTRGPRSRRAPSSGN